MSAALAGISWLDLSLDLLPDWYDDWLVDDREGVRQLRLHALERVTGELSLSGRHAEAIQTALAAVRLEPLRETAHAALIKAHLAEGNRSEALRQFYRCRDVLSAELAVEPSESIRQLISSPPSPFRIQISRLTLWNYDPILSACVIYDSLACCCSRISQFRTAPHVSSTEVLVRTVRSAWPGLTQTTRTRSFGLPDGSAQARSTRISRAASIAQPSPVHRHPTVTASRSMHTQASHVTRRRHIPASLARGGH